ncbi:Dynein regulatory complex subunit 7 [Echinococcus granulosus]|nr:Dynein regulatory complex subunit 7 [Echinococcus granulosus]
MEQDHVKELEEVDLPTRQRVSEDADHSYDSKAFTAPPAEEAEKTPESLQLKQQLIEINPLYLPHEFRSLPQSFDPKEYNFPPSYTENSARETRLLTYADNFRRQYAGRFHDRTPLFLTPHNECDLRKFVSTTIRPTKLPFPELHEALGAAAFVADFLDFAPLLPCTELPPRLLSPRTTLFLQLGTCFDYTTLLCSLLTGVGYNAFVVSGYATRECCYKDESRKQCPLLVKPPKCVEMYQEPQAGRYQVKPVRNFLSKYEVTMRVKRLVEAEKAAEKKVAEDKKAQEKAEEPKKDPLYGLRVHSWILVLPGSRDVHEAFFIEPFTGESVALDTDMYLGIESVWNHNNYWVNMQDCTNGIQEMRYDLNNLEDWEFVLPSGLLNTMLMESGDQLINIFNASMDVAETLANYNLGLDYGLQVHEDELNGKARKNEKKKMQADLLDTLLLVDMPMSWTLPITLSNTQYFQRYPNFQKEILYNRARVIKYTPYSQECGIVVRLTVYQDRDLQDAIEEREYFKHRRDRLNVRVTDLKTLWVKESFDHGRMGYHLKEHEYMSKNLGADANRCMEFYEKMRVDGLLKRQREGNIMKEWYTNREDRLVYRETHFGRTVRKFGPPVIVKSSTQHGSVDPKVTKKSYKEIEVIKERFARNPEISADEDVEERVFDIAGEKYFLTYHVADECIFPCRREFNKPPDSGDRRQVIELHPDTHNSFHPSLNPPRKTKVEIYQMLLELIDLEKVAKETVRASESEVQAILDKRAAEEAKPELEVGLWDTQRNSEIHNLRIALEQHAEQERRKQKEKDLDYLAPYFHMHDIDGDNLSREDAYAVREACLQDLKERLIKKANIIQARFEAETSALQRKQQWFQLNQINLTKEDEAAYLQYCNDAIFKITTLETMLLRHKQTAPQKYMLLEKQLRSDPRLAEYLNTT